MFRKNINLYNAITNINLDSIDIDVYKKDIASILQINLPSFISFKYIFEKDGVLLYQDPPLDYTYFLRGYYLDEKNIIYLSTLYPKKDINTGKTTFISPPPQEYLFTLLHEWRHVWQKKYQFNKYYKYNAIGEEVIQDISEIDADAFALAYIFSNKTPFSADDLLFSVFQMRLQGYYDDGQRWNRAEELAADYGFDISEKLLAAKGGSIAGKK